MAGGYLGKISAVVAVNASSVAPTLNSAGKTVNDWARKTQSTINSAMNSAGRSISGIYTPLQKLETALKQANRLPLQLRVQNPRQILQVARAAEQIAKPLGTAQQGFTRLSKAVQAELQPVLQAAQKQSTQLFEALSNGAKVSETDIQNTSARVERLTAALSRAGEASKLVGQLSTGRELRFQNPEFVQQINRTAQLQQQAASVPSLQLSSGIVDLIVKQRAAADEAERLRAALDRIRTTQKGDASAAAVAYNAQIAALGRINDELEKQIGLTQKSQAVRDAEAAAAPLIRDQRAQRDADRVFQAESERLRRQAEADNLAAAQRASSLLNVDQLASNEGLRSERATRLGPNYLQDAFARQIRGELGPAITDQQRQFDVLRGSIVSVKGQLDTLPASVRSQFIPAIQQAEAEFQRLRALGPDATAEAIENAANEVDRLNRQLRGVSQVQALPNFAQALDDSAIRGSIGSLNALQQILSRVGAEAGSNAAVQFDRMRAAIQRATADGTIGSQAFQNELREIARDAAAAAAETGRIGQGAAFREIQRGGDVARGGFDRLSLATQQAAFAIDDFLSVQGDFSQRIRAVQNNVTQLAFILGGTTGLFIGLGVAIAAQATVALIKWANGGRTAEDQTKALNDALARQKSLVEELAQAFESLGDSIARRAFSDSAQQARAFGKEIDDIVKKQKELRENRIADLDPGTQRERAEQNRIERELEASSDPRERARLAADLRRSQEREQLTRQAAVGQASPSIGRLQELVAGSATDEIRAYMQRRMIPPRSIEQAQQQELDQLGDGSNLRATRTAINNRIEELRSSPVANDEAVRRAVYELEQALAVIDRDIGEAADALAVSVLESANSLSLGIESAQQDVEDAIRRGVAGAADFQAGLDNTAKQLEAAEKRLAEAQNVRDPVQREEAVRAAQAEVRDLQLRQDAIAEEARNVRLTTGRGGQRTEAALSALQGNERFANEYGRLTARLRDAVDQEAQARQNLAITNKEGNDAAKATARAELDAATAASDLAAAAAEAALAMEKALARIRKIGDDALRGSEQIADEAQRNFTQDPTAENRRERDAAEQQLIRDRERVARANNALDRARSVAEATDPRVKQINEELEAIRRERNQISDKSAQDRTEEDARRAEELANREASLQAEREERLRQLTSAERDQQDAIAQEIAAREKMIAALEKQRAFDEEVERRRNPQGDAIRGLDLAETPGQRAAREAAQGILDIDAAFRERGRQLVEQFGGLFDINAAEQVFIDQNEAARQESIRRFASEQRRAAAPAIFGFADSVENALLQGPSRAALNASDISTQEGARELNRLLRGDDSARDQNLIELQRQSQALDDVNAKLTALGNRVGVAL